MINWIETFEDCKICGGSGSISDRGTAVKIPCYECHGIGTRSKYIFEDRAVNIVHNSEVLDILKRIEQKLDELLNK